MRHKECCHQPMWAATDLLDPGSKTEGNAVRAGLLHYPDSNTSCIASQCWKASFSLVFGSGAQLGLVTSPYFHQQMPGCLPSIISSFFTISSAAHERNSSMFMSHKINQVWEQGRILSHFKHILGFQMSMNKLI